MSFLRLTRSLPFSNFFRQLEQEAETVINVLQPGPLGIIEHKFSAEEVREAKAAVERAVINWKMNAVLEKSSPIMKDHIDCYALRKETQKIMALLGYMRAFFTLFSFQHMLFLFICSISSSYLSADLRMIHLRPLQQSHIF